MTEPRSPSEGDSELLVALLEAHGHLELSGIAAALLHTVTRWSRARSGAAYLPRDGGVVFGPDLGGGIVAPDGAAFPEIASSILDAALRGRCDAEFEGLGPFSSSESAAGLDVPSRTWVLALRDPEGRLVGALVLYDPPPGDRDRIRVLLERAGIAIGHAVEVAGVRELVIKDDTANCFNRRHFEDALPEELARAARFRAPLSLIFFDLDNLKQVNSRHGHAMGSRTLYEVSVRVRSRIRKFDKLFRFGGDEFCIVLPETEWHGALEVAERVRESLAGSNFLKGLVANHDGIAITASFGIASYPLHARTKDEMVVQADRAMQRVKNGTKNSIAIAEILGSTG